VAYINSSEKRAAEQLPAREYWTAMGIASSFKKRKKFRNPKSGKRRGTCRY
jgi:hypothetical protein